MHGLANMEKQQKIFRYLHEEKFDFVLIQESHMKKTKEKIYRNEWGGKIVFDHGESNARGVCTLIAPHLDVTILKTTRSNEGRFLMVDLRIGEHKIMIANVYAPNEDDPVFFERILKQVIESEMDNKILGGDLNIIMDEELDKKSLGKGKKVRSKAASLVNNFMSENEWIDIWHLKHPESFQYTWKRNKPITMSRLDYFLIPQFNIGNTVDCRIIPGIDSDHSFVILEFEFIELVKGRGFWKMNNSLLQNSEYLNEVNELLDMASYRYDNLTPSLHWEMIKMDIREHAIFFGKKQATKTKLRTNELKRKLYTQEKKLACINMQANNVVSLIQKINVKIDEIKKEISEIERKKTQGAILCSKIKYYEMGEKNTKYFFGLEKSRAKSKIMTKIMNEKGVVTTKPKEILHEQKKFYDKLYKAEEDVSFCVDWVPEKILSEDQRVSLEKQITLDELGQALINTKNNKTPGLCGITADFLKVFWLCIKHYLHKAVNESYEVKRIFPSGRQGIITLIPKAGRNNLLLKEWLPIILLCSDYKLIAKVIAERMKKVMTTIIHEDQKGFVHGRHIAQNMRQIIDTADLCVKKKIEGLLITIDFEKAFDMVQYQSLYKIMEIFNFGPIMIKWMKILFSDFSLTTLNNGITSEPIYPSRGLFQGNPISSYCFITVIETLTILLRKNKNIKGIQIGQIKNLLSMFADDMNIFTQNREQEWLEIRAILQQFRYLTGLRVNYEKTSIYRLGIHSKLAKFYSMKKLKWSDKINVLGIIITPNTTQMHNLNIEPLLEKARNTLESWSVRDLSLIGRILIVNTLIGSLFNYRLAVLKQLSNAHVKTFNSIISNFIWKGKKAKIPMKILQGNKDDGGLALIDIQKKIRL